MTKHKDPIECPCCGRGPVEHGVCASCGVGVAPGSSYAHVWTARFRCRCRPDQNEVSPGVDAAHYKEDHRE